MKSVDGLFFVYQKAKAALLVTYILKEEAEYLGLYNICVD
jgi:hypothetical protein